MNPIPVNLAVEDPLSEAVLRRLLAGVAGKYAIGTVYGHTGFGYLRKTVRGWNHAARGVPFVLLTDLDKYSCPPELLQDWLNQPQHPSLLFRVAVREVEAWLLADRNNIAAFLGVPVDPESVADPKAALVNLARRSRRAEVRERVVPRRGSTARVGPDYNGCLGDFVRRTWNVEAAANMSHSLRRAVDRLRHFQPTWAGGPKV